MELDITATMETIEIGATGATEIIQNVKTIISTIRGTVPLDRTFGISWDFIDMPAPASRAAFIAEIVEEVEKQEPRVNVISVSWDEDQAKEMDGKPTPTIKIKIKDEYL